MNFLNIFSIGTIYEIIIKEINDNKKSCFKLRSSCKKIKNTMDEYGFLKSIVYKFNSNLINFLKVIDNHLFSLNTITMDRAVDPHLLIPEMVKNFIIINCDFTQVFDLPFTLEKLENLEIYYGGEKKEFAWHKMTNLKTLYIKDAFVDLSGISSCKKLKKLVIMTPYINNLNFTSENKRKIMDEIISLPNLQTLIYTDNIEEQQVITSPELEFLLIFGKKIIVKSQKIKYMCNGEWEFGTPDYTNWMLDESILLFKLFKLHHYKVCNKVNYGDLIVFGYRIGC